MHLFTISSNYAFVDSLAAGILHRFGSQMQAHSDMLLLLPNRRSAQALKDAFLRLSDGNATLLPRMMPLGDIEEEHINMAMLAAGKLMEVPSAIAPVRQQLLLAKLTHQWRKTKQGNDAMFVHSLKLAGELAAFLSEVEREQLSFDNLENLYPEEFQAHWQDTLEFLKILVENWPELLKEQQAITVTEYRNTMLALQAEIWQQEPPEYPIIAAGAVGGVPAVSNLLSVIASLPNGHVVLPGLDQHIDDKSCQAIGETHPQYEIKQLLDKLKAPRNKVEIWHEDASFQTAPEARLELASQLMRPAETAQEWLRYKPEADAFANITQLEASSLHEEAGIIALMLRETLETQSKTAALVTHDRSLARHVVMALKRWNINVDDSAGKPLAESTPAVFLRLVAGLLEQDSSLFGLLACLKHPYTAVGYAPLVCLNHVRKLEHYYLRGVCKAKTPQDLLLLLKKNGEDTPLIEFLEHLCDALSPLSRMRALREKVRLMDVLDVVIQVAEALATSDAEAGETRLWSSDAAEQLQAWYQQLYDIKDIPQTVYATEAESLIEALLEGKTFRPSYGLHPRLHILGPLEARLQHYDRLILGGLNEGSWPSLPSADPWMSRPMRIKFGLPLPEQRIGQSAHDFMQYFCANEVVLTRSRKIDGAEATPSRWWMRLGAVLEASGNQNALVAEKPWHSWYQALYASKQEVAITSPMPKPPLGLRPRRLSVTNIENLQQNPYAIYAKYVLRLRALEELDKAPGALEFGNFIHKVVENFAQRLWQDTLSVEEMTAIWLEQAEKVFLEQQLPQSIKLLWWPRTTRIAAELVVLEKQRRQQIKQSYSEIKGEYSFESEGGTFTLTAKADRLEIDRQACLHVIDYKTGAAPFPSSVAQGKKPQLPLEALIAINGGFKDLVPVPQHVAELAYWKVSGRKKAIELSSFVSTKKEPERIENWVKEAQTGLKQLVAWFDDEQHAYIAYPFGSGHIKFDDYAHLIREEEWGI